METQETSGEADLFNASGFLQFAMNDEAKANTDFLFGVLQGIDDKFPWVHIYPSGDRAPSISWYSQWQEKEGSDWTSHTYTIEIRPRHCLRFGQMLAYQRYVKTLAKELTKLQIPGVHGVKGRATFDGMF